MKETSFTFYERLKSELVFSVARSSGPGGQNVNKVNSKVILKLDVPTSQLLTVDEKVLLFKKLKTKITDDGVLAVTSQEARSQLDNKRTAILKFDKLLAQAFTKKKPRKATKPGKGAIQKRIDSKKSQSEKKQWRKKL